MPMMLRKAARALVPNSAAGWLLSLLPAGVRSYAGSAEDLFAAKFFDSRNGFYVDIGAFHPKVASTTYLLYRRGWRGLNIDLDAAKIALFRRVRPRDISVCAAVKGSESGTATVYRVDRDRLGSMTSLDEAFSRRRAAEFGWTLEEATVPVRPVNDILAEHVPVRDGKPVAIDFLNIDVEGIEHEILGALDFSRFAPRCAMVEIVAESIEEIAAHPVTQLMRAKGYVPAAWLNPTVMFIAGSEGAARPL
jgi:FkbM family methyltransferase